MGREEGTCRSGGETLAWGVHRAWAAGAPTLLSLHGGGPSDGRSTDYLAEVVTGRGWNLLAFDFSGQGRSSGTLAASSLDKRLDEARAVVTATGLTPAALVGTSMGGPLAVRLALTFPVQALVLFCPAAYSRRAWSLAFGGGFTEEIRRPESFLDTDTGDHGREFRGDVLLVSAGEDAVIPGAVTQMYRTVFQAARSFNELVLPGCPHPIHRWAADRIAVQDRIRDAVGSLLETVGR